MDEILNQSKYMKFNFNVIRNILEDRNISLKAFAKSLGMSYSGFNQLLANNSTSTKTLEKISEALNVGLDMFIVNENAVQAANAASTVPGVDIWQRITLIRVSESMNHKQFAEKIGVNEKTFNAMMSRKTDPGLDVIKALVSLYPNMDPRWIILGDGDQYMDEYNMASEPHSRYARRRCKDCEYYKKIIINQNELIDELRKRQKE